MASFYSADNTVLQQWFGQVDSDRSGQVNSAELQRALAQGGLNFSMKLVSSMIRMYDADKTAQLSFAQFIELHKFLANVQRVFATADRDRSGQLDLNEIYTALSGLGHTLDRAPGGSFYTLCQSYDFDRSGKIALDSFIAMVVLLENAKRLHAAFDPNRTGTASFDLNQVRSLPPHLTASCDAPHPYRPFAPPNLPPHRPCPHSYGSDLCHLSLFGRSPCCRARHAPAPRVLRRHPRCGAVVAERST